MTLTSIDISTRSLSSSTQDKAPSSTDKEPSAGIDFAAVMTAMLAQQGPLTTQPAAAPSTVLTDPSALGDQTLMAFATTSALTGNLLPQPAAWRDQDVAAPTSNAGGAGDPLLLTALQIGPHLQVITPQTAAPEGQSLEMFARSQGLDEAALQWLMGTSNLTRTPAGLTSSPAGLTPTGGMALETPLGLLPSQRASDATPISPLPLQPAATTPPPWAMAGTGVDVNPKTQTGRGAPASLIPGLALPSATDDTAPITITVMKSDPATELKAEAAVGANVAATASDWLKSNTIGLTSVKSSVLGKLDLPLKVLDLSQLFTPELQATLETLNAGEAATGQESPSHGHGSFSIKPDLSSMARTESASNAAAAPEMDSAQRRENIQNLAEKMGQAVGQRILSELERGQWQLKLSLRPARLGHIEVDMRMRGGEMDAVFTAGQALTRELLNEGMSKLKETLNQMGMDVASLKVDDGQSRQRGGESTPDRQANVRDNAPTESADASASQPVRVPSKMGVDGWDVMV